MEPLRRAARSATQPEVRALRADARELPSAPAVERPWLDRHRVVVYFLVALLAVDFGVATHRDLWNLYTPDDYIERVEGCLQTVPDVVLLGGSTVSEGIDPAALAGLRWRGQSLQRPYNLGLPGATTSEVWHAVEHSFREPPRLVVYGLTASDWNDSRQEPHGPSALMSASDVAAWVVARPDSAEWVIRHFIQDHIARLWNLFYYRNGIRLWAVATADTLWPDLFPAAATLCGLWHGAYWNYVLWGAYNGALVAAHRAYDRALHGRPWAERLRSSAAFAVGATAGTLLLVLTGFVMVRSQSWSGCWLVQQSLIGWNAAGAGTRWVPVGVPVLVGLVAAGHALGALGARTFRLLDLPPALRAATYATAVVLLVVLGPWSSNTFIYFQF